MIKNISHYFFATLVGTSLSFILLPFYTNYLSLSDFGILALAYIFEIFWQVYCPSLYQQLLTDFIIHLKK